ncbi:porin family protein, partial [bacterium]
MKNLIAILAFIMVCQAQAQQPVQVQVAAPQAAPAQKKTLIYDERTNQLVEVAPTVNAAPTAQAQNNAEATATAVAPAAPAASPIYILNNQRLQGYQGASQAAIQEQPTTVIVDAPAKSSASDSIRKQRAETEAGTEDGIVHALEKARLEDEMRRREKFAAALAPSPAPTAVQQQQQVVVTAPPAPAAVVVQQQQQAVVAVPAEVVEVEAPQHVPQKPQRRAKKIVVEEVDDQADTKAEIRAALAERDAKKPSKTNYYVSGLVGMGVYPDAEYIQSALATGFTLGMVTSNNIVIEGSFAYGDYTLGDNSYYGYGAPTIDMAQYDFSAALKYQILSGKIRPTAGVIAAYTHRNYTSDMFSYGYGYNNADGITTDGFNAGLTAGVDVSLTDSFSIGVDFRYLWSIASRDNSNPYSNNFQATSNNSFRPETIEDMA